MQKFDKYLKTILGALVAFTLLLALVLVLLNPQKNYSPLPEPTALKPATTTIFLAGDIMLSRNVAKKIYSANDPNLPFRSIQDEISSADISFANLESPFNDKGNHAVENSLIFNADPNFVSGLKAAGFDILSTANNHALDQGLAGLDLTIDTLINNGIIPTGTMKTDGKPILPVIKKNNILFGFLSYSYTAKNDGGKSSSPYVNNFNDLAKLKQDVLNLRGHYADVVIVNMHAGTEYTRKPTQAQINFAHAAIDAGADLVVGEHPHWIQTIEQYEGKWIFYSLGNFVFDQMWSTDTRQGLTVKLTFADKALTKIDLLPVIIDDYSTPRLANNDEIQAILAKIGLTDTTLMNNN